MPKQRELRPLDNNVKKNVEIPELKPMRKIERPQKTLTLKELSIQFDESWKLAIKEIQTLGKFIKRLATEMYKQNAEIEKELRKKATRDELSAIWEAIDKRTQDIAKLLKAVRKESRPVKGEGVTKEILDLIQKENQKLEEQLVKHEQALKEALEKSIEIIKKKEEEEGKELEEPKERILEAIEKHLKEFNEKALGRFIETKAILNDIELNILTRQDEFKELIEELKVKGTGDEKIEDLEEEK